MPARVYSAGMFAFRVSSFVLVLCAASQARAGNYGVEPIRFELKTRARSQLLTVTSHAAESVRIEVQPQVWAQNPDGTHKLTPTKALIVFPSLLTLKPGEVKRVRLAVKTEPKDRELTYRVFLRELPPPGKTSSMKFLVQMSVPIYHLPAELKRSAVLDSLRVDKGVLSFVFENRGNVHYAGEVKVRALDKKGAPVHEEKIPSQVVLTGVKRQLSVNLPKDKCPQIASIELELAGHGQTTTARLPSVTASACNKP